MRGDVEHALLAVEDGLRAVAVVDVEVHDHHPLEAAREGVGGRHRHVVEEAEAHGPVGQGVMARRPHRAEGAVELAVEHAVHRIHHRPRGQDRGGVGLRTGLGVGIEAVRAPLGGGHERDVPGRVDTQQLRRGGGPRGRHAEPWLEPRLPDPAAQGLQALGPLRVPIAGVVLAGRADRRRGRHGPCPCAPTFSHRGRSTSSTLLDSPRR